MGAGAFVSRARSRGGDAVLPMRDDDPDDRPSPMPRILLAMTLLFPFLVALGLYISEQL